MQFLNSNLMKFSKSLTHLITFGLYLSMHKYYKLLVYLAVIVIFSVKMINTKKKVVSIIIKIFQIWIPLIKIKKKHNYYLFSGYLYRQNFSLNIKLSLFGKILFFSAQIDYQWKTIYTDISAFFQNRIKIIISCYSEWKGL